MKKSLVLVTLLSLSSLISWYLPESLARSPSWQKFQKSQQWPGLDPSLTQTSGELPLTVIRCHDGDTCTAKTEKGYQITLRLVGVDAPEVTWNGKTGQSYGQEAKNYLESRVKSKIVKTKIMGADRYHRSLALIYVPSDSDPVPTAQNQSASINEELVRLGYAFAYSGKAVSPEIRKWAENAQKYAQEHKLGLWGLKTPPLDPSIFRHGR